MRVALHFFGKKNVRKTYNMYVRNKKNIVSYYILPPSQNNSVFLNDRLDRLHVV